MVPGSRGGQVAASGRSLCTITTWSNLAGDRGPAAVDRSVEAEPGRPQPGTDAVGPAGNLFVIARDEQRQQCSGSRRFANQRARRERWAAVRCQSTAAPKRLPASAPRAACRRTLLQHHDTPRPGVPTSTTPSSLDRLPRCRSGSPTWLATSWPRMATDAPSPVRQATVASGCWSVMVADTEGGGEVSHRYLAGVIATGVVGSSWRRGRVSAVVPADGSAALRW